MVGLDSTSHSGQSKATPELQCPLHHHGGLHHGLSSLCGAAFGAALALARAARIAAAAAAATTTAEAARRCRESPAEPGACANGSDSRRARRSSAPATAGPPGGSCSERGFDEETEAARRVAVLLDGSKVRLPPLRAAEAPAAADTVQALGKLTLAGRRRLAKALAAGRLRTALRSLRFSPPSISKLTSTCFNCSSTASLLPHDSTPSAMLSVYAWCIRLRSSASRSHSFCRPCASARQSLPPLPPASSSKRASRRPFKLAMAAKPCSDWTSAWSSSMSRLATKEATSKGKATKEGKRGVA
mmetsp:Transcript_143320/g.458334  ORF Transcript_143320/g.458334 Transcript_143320/m.458334 type:complete len:301 (+) Transcript_143320:74-976(+)